MRLLLVHPSPLMYSEIYLRLEPLGLELVAEAARRAGHRVRLLDLQVHRQKHYFSLLDEFRPEAVGFSLNYLANVPEVIDLAKATRRLGPSSFLFVGGHSASFTAREILEHGKGSIDCVLRGEGEVAVPRLLEAAESDRNRVGEIPGVTTLDGDERPPALVASLDDLFPARDLLARRRKYFIGVLDPCASVEFTRGCPWDCAFCSAWTFYGRSYRVASPEKAVEELARIREPGVFVVDDVAFIRADHGFQLARAIEKRRIQKKYYLETRGDVLLRNREVFEYWKRLGLQYMFLGIEAVDEESLRKFRKRITLGKNFEALEVARSLGITVAINIIADPDWDQRRFQIIREWALSVPEIVHLTVNTPYPGTETWLSESSRIRSRDYSLFDVQHAVLPTRLPLRVFYEELVRTQAVLNKKHLGFAALRETTALAARLLLRGQTNFVQMLWKFRSVYNPDRQLADHRRRARYSLSVPGDGKTGAESAADLFVHRPKRRAGSVAPSVGALAPRMRASGAPRAGSATATPAASRGPEAERPKEPLEGRPGLRTAGGPGDQHV